MTPQTDTPPMSTMPANSLPESALSESTLPVSTPAPEDATSALDGTVAAFIDLGTNSVRLLVARIETGGAISTITQQKESVRLGEGEFIDKLLQPPAMDRALEVCRRFADLSRSYGATDVISVATSATREARNQEEFIARLLAEAGLDVRVISGREEARLIFTGMVNTVHLNGRTALFIDIGGGSTEVMIGDRGEHQFLDSLALGAIRMTAAVSDSIDMSRPVSKDQYKLLRRRVRYAASHTLQQAAAHPFDVAFGSSGTIANLAVVAARTASPPRQTEDILTYDELKRVVALICSLELDGRRRLPGINPERADIIIAGAAILHTIMKDLHVPQIQAVPDVGLREGLLYDHLARLGHAGALQELSVRMRSVLQLGRACRFDEPHARTVASFALRLFDSAGEAGLHAHGDAERELLEYAALLHDIGTFLSYSNHHTHTYYLIRNSDLLGFDQREIAIIAATAYFHRKGLPSARHPGFAALDAASRETVRMLSLFLRIAESLDRSHSGMMTGVRLLLPDRRRAVLEIEAQGDIQLEIWGIENRRRAIEKGLGRLLEIEVLDRAGRSLASGRAAQSADPRDPLDRSDPDRGAAGL